MEDDVTGARSGVMSLFSQVADGLGRLVGQHLKLARLELAASLAGMSRGAALVAVLAGLTIVGHTLAMAGLAVLIGGNAAVGLPLLVMGLGHMAACGGGMLVATARLRRTHLMHVSADAAGRSLARLGVATESTHLVSRDQEKASVR